MRTVRGLGWLRPTSKTQPKPKMKTNPNHRGFTRQTQTKTLALGMLCASLTGNLLAQAPCPAVETFAAGLVAPSKIIQTPLGNFLVAEGGPEVPNNGRISIVDQ